MKLKELFTLWRDRAPVDVKIASVLLLLMVVAAVVFISGSVLHIIDEEYASDREKAEVVVALTMEDATKYEKSANMVPSSAYRPVIITFDDGKQYRTSIVQYELERIEEGKKILLTYQLKRLSGGIKIFSIEPIRIPPAS